MKNKPKSANTLVLSYLELRRGVGILGVTLPLVIFLGSLLIFKTGLQGSVSAYYYTGMRDVLVGTLCAIGIFLWSYKGYDETDDLAGNLACIFAVGLALFPTAPDTATPGSTAAIIGTIHFIFAALFFGALIYFALFQFTKTEPHSKKPPTTRKKLRNRVYRGCGYAMLACVALMLVYNLLPAAQAASLKFLRPIFWLETIAVLSFGISWLVKGETLLKD
jgi:hypothetical protein